MKIMRKLIAFLLVAVLALALGVTAFADEPSTGSTIVVKDAVDGIKYTAYKIFNVSYTGVGQDDPHSYTVQAPWLSVVQNYLAISEHANEMTLTQIGETGVYNVTDYTNLKAADFAAYLIANMPTSSESKSATASGRQAEITGLTPGYYLVDSTLGALCVLETAHETAEIQEKNSKPTVDKKIEGRDTSAAAQIGEPINFTITVDLGSTEFSDDLGTGIDTTVKLTDTMTHMTPIELEDNPGSYLTVTTDKGETLTAPNHYQETWDSTNNTFTIELWRSKLQKLDPGTKITISYQAYLTDKATTKSTANPNTVVLSYHNYSQSDTVYARTFKFDICKTDAKNEFLSDATGAKFKLYSDASCADDKEIPVIWVEERGYRPALTGEKAAACIDMSTVESGGHGAKVTVFGICGDYWLKEVAAPVGYNQLPDPVPVTAEKNLANNDDLEAGEYTTGGIQIINNTGSLLPETGGEGTKLLIACGCILFLGTAVVLVTKKRMYNKG